MLSSLSPTSSFDLDRLVNKTNKERMHIMKLKYEISFRDAMKDADGYAKLVVKVGEWYVPALGKPVSFTAYDRCHNLIGEDIADIKRLNLTKWDLKDIPEIAERTGKLFGCECILYWNGHECAWKFFEDGFYGIDDDSDEVIEILDDYIDSHSTEFYEPHNDRGEIIGDKNVHCVYFGNSDVQIFSDCSDKEVESWDGGFPEQNVVMLGCVEVDSFESLKDEALRLVSKARWDHKKIPYSEIGGALRQLVSKMDDIELGKCLTHEQL